MPAHARCAVNNRAAICVIRMRASAIISDVMCGQVVGACGADYPLSKKHHRCGMQRSCPADHRSFEYLREHVHLRPRSNVMGAVLRVRDAAVTAMRDHFRRHGYLDVHTPAITSNDCEGGSDAFLVSQQACCCLRSACT